MHPQLLALLNLELLIAMAFPLIATASNLLAIPKSEVCKLRNSQVKRRVTMNLLKKHCHDGSQLFKSPDETRRLNGRSNMYGT